MYAENSTLQHAINSEWVKQQLSRLCRQKQNQKQNQNFFFNDDNNNNNNNNNKKKK